MRLIHILALILLLLSCALNPESSSPECQAHISRVEFHVSSSFTGDEQVKLLEAAQDWGFFSQDRIRFKLIYDGYTPPGTPSIIRVHSQDAIVRSYDEIQQAIRGTDYQANGWYEPVVNRLYLVVDRLDGEKFRLVATHEMGHAAGLRWPDCDEDLKQTCEHARDPSALMAQRYSNNPLGPGDLEFCRASCLCP